jgi:DNA-binding NarL/FixJ family response regulator
VATLRVPFVGRKRELDALVALLRQGRRDRLPVAGLIWGEPGSGKTRLLAELVAHSPFDRIIRVVGFEPIQPIPLAAVSDLLRQLAKTPTYGATLESLVFGDLDQSSRDPLRIFEAAHRALSSFGPLVVAIDDLQWLDELSLALVHYLLRAADPSRQQLVVITAARPSPAAAAYRSSAEADLPAERTVFIELGPLSLEDGLLLARTIDVSLDDDSGADLWRRAAGSPFWVEALARGRGSGDPSTLIDERLRTLSSDAGQVLAALAVGARPMAVDDVGRLIGWEIDRIRHASRELSTRGLALETAGNLRLAHDLIREAAVATLPSASSRRLHGLLAELIEAGSGDDLQMLGEALEHRAAAGLPTAALASRLLASPQRRLIGAEGLRLIASISDGLDYGTPEQLWLDTGVGDLAAVLGDQELAIDRWTRVKDRSNDPAASQRAGLEAARAAYRLARSNDAHRYLDHARASARSTPEMAVELDALEAEIELWLDHETAAGNRTGERALARAREMAVTAGGVERLSTSARRAYLAALEAATDGALQEDRGTDVISLSDATVLVARDIDEEAYIAALMRPGFALRPLGRIREAEARYRQAWDTSRRLVMPTAMVEAGHGLARALRDLGRLAEARQIATETIQLEIRLGHPPGRWGNAPSVLHGIELSLGDPTAAVRALRRDAEEERDPHYRQAVHQVIAAWQARFAGARLASEVEEELAEARSASALARCPRCSAELSVVSAELLARIGRPEDARRELVAWEAGHTTTTYLMREVWRARARAAIAMAEDDQAEAASLLEALIGALQNASLVDDLLWARLDLGRALERVDRDRAVAAFAEAARLAESIGAVTQRRLAARALRDLGVRAWRRGRAKAGDRLDGLSDREREVADLVADGRSNREIAEELLVSPKTVERHLTNVLAKLGLRNRTEVASLVRTSTVRGSPDE